MKTAQTVWQARSLCPQLVCVPPHMDKYREFSVLARQIYLRYTDLVEPFSIDECWLDVTGSSLLFGSGEEIAQRISADMQNELGITVSIGVSFCKFSQSFQAISISRTAYSLQSAAIIKKSSIRAR